MATEAPAQAQFRFSSTLSFFRIYIEANTGGNTVTGTCRINGSTVNSTASSGVGTTGLFEDATHSDSVASGDLLCFTHIGSSSASYLISSLSGTFGAPVTNIPVTGIAGTGAAGTVVPEIDVALTGTSATGTAGTVLGGTGGQLTGASATGVVNDPVAEIDVGVVGAEATGVAGTVGAAAGGVVLITGVGGAGQAGNVTIEVDSNATIAGVHATAAFDTVLPKMR